MAIIDILTAIQDGPVGSAIAENGSLFPMIECVHVTTITFVAGTVLMMDLRLLGVAGRDQAVSKLNEEILPWTWGAFVLAAIAGSLLFTSNATGYYNNGQFRLKMICMACAAINMLVYHLITEKTVHSWDIDAPTPTGAKVAGFLSLVFWGLVIAFGRWVGFTIGA
jgi:hypothetical protein